MNWHTISSPHDLEAIIDRSRVVPCLILKHSTSCPISSMAKRRLEMNWDVPAEKMELYYLDLLRHRDISNQIAEEFGVRHESPQVLLIRDGESVYDASHLGIRADLLASA